MAVSQATMGAKRTRNDLDVWAVKSGAHNQAADAAEACDTAGSCTHKVNT